MLHINRDVLLLVAMDGQGGPAVLSKVLGDVVGHPFSAHEDQDLGVFTADHIEMFEEFASLLEIGADFDILLNVMVSRQVHRTDVNLNKVVQEIL